MRCTLYVRYNWEGIYNHQSVVNFGLCKRKTNIDGLQHRYHYDADQSHIDTGAKSKWDQATSLTIMWFNEMLYEIFLTSGYI